MPSIRSIAVALAAAAFAAPASAQTEVRVALLPIAVHSQGSDSAYLEMGLAVMLSARLEQYQGIDVVRPAADAVPASTQDEALQRARDAQADLVLYGSFTRFGDGASLDLRCAHVVAAGGEELEDDPARRVFIQAGTLAAIIPDLDTLVEKVARFAFETAATPPRRGEGDAAVAATNGLERVSPEEVQDLRGRVEALERAVYTPVAQGEPPPPAEVEPDGEANPSVVQ